MFIFTLITQECWLVGSVGPITQNNEICRAVVYQDQGWELLWVNWTTTWISSFPITTRSFSWEECIFSPQKYSAINLMWLFYNAIIVNRLLKTIPFICFWYPLHAGQHKVSCPTIWSFNFISFYEMQNFEPFYGKYAKNSGSWICLKLYNYCRSRYNVKHYNHHFKI